MKQIFMVLAVGLVIWFGETEGQAHFKIHIYGNWCGPGVGFKKPPIDELDRACMRHDYCVRNTIKKSKLKKIVPGIQFCRCDRPLIIAARRQARVHKSKKARSKAKLIANYFSNTICFCTRKVCAKLPSCKKGKKKCKTLFGKKICVKVPVCKKKKACKKILGKKRCIPKPSCKMVRKCTTPKARKICIKPPSCKMTRKCGKVKVPGRGGKCAFGSY